MPSEPAARLISPGELAPGPINSHTAVIRPGVHTIHTAGQVGSDINGQTSSSYPEQIKQALANLEACLLAAGASPRDIVKLTYYIVNYDPKNRPHAEIIPKWLKGLRPVTTLVPVPALASPDYLFEIEAVAAVRDPTTHPAFIRPPLKSVANVDVVVVGAGLSGLQAAYDVQKAGYSCVVLEARDRVGGKTWTVPINGGKGGMDVGAAWINSVNQSRMWALAQRFGLETVEQNVKGDAMSQEAGRFPFGALPNVRTALSPITTETKLTSENSFQRKTRTTLLWSGTSSRNSATLLTSTRHGLIRPPSMVNPLLILFYHSVPLPPLYQQ